MRKEICFLILSICCLSICPLFGQYNQRDNSKELSEEEFIEKYGRWLPERIVSYPTPEGGIPPLPDKNNIIQLICDGLKIEDEWCFSIEIHSYNKARFKAPYPDIIDTLGLSIYTAQVEYIPRYSIFPLFGRFIMLTF
jgi:hypothetical protein